MFADRLQIGSVIESVSDLQGEGQAPAGKCTVSYLHIPNGWHDHSNAELALNKNKNTMLRIKERKDELLLCLSVLSSPFHHHPVNARLTATAESLHESIQTTCLLINLLNTRRCISELMQR